MSTSRTSGGLAGCRSGRTRRFPAFGKSGPTQRPTWSGTKVRALWARPPGTGDHPQKIPLPNGGTSPSDWDGCGLPGDRHPVKLAVAPHSERKWARQHRRGSASNVCRWVYAPRRRSPNTSTPQPNGGMTPSDRGGCGLPGADN